MKISYRKEFLNNKLRVQMNNLWVNDLINQTIEKGWCTQFFCTTCGAGDFKGSLRRHLDSVLGTRRFGVPFVFNSNDADVILEQLKSLKPIDFSDNYPREWVIMFLLYISWQTSPSDETTASMSEKLDGTYAGSILSSMIKDYARITAERLEYERKQSPEYVAKMRAEKKARKQELHQERMRLQKIRSEKFHADNLGMG